MKKIFSFQLLILTVAIGLCLSGVLRDRVAQAQFAAQPDSSPNSSPNSLQFTAPPLPRSGAPSGRGRGGASRGDCPAVKQPLTALVPSTTEGGDQPDQPATESVWGLTAAAHPTFWFYVPYGLTPEHSAEFVLLDEAGNEVYKTILADSTTSEGIIQVSLPATQKPLEVGKMYQWVFMVNCEVDNPIFTKGGIQRITLDPTLAHQLTQNTPQQQAKLYAAYGVWFDALTTVAKLRLAEPSNRSIATNWDTLLRSVGLADVADKPLLSCCS